MYLLNYSVLGIIMLMATLTELCITPTHTPMALPFKKRVLIIEDDQEIRKSFTLIVNSSPRFVVINAYPTCEEAVKNLMHDKPEIINGY